MKRPAILTLIGGALFGAGYWCGGPGGDAARVTSRHGSMASIASEQGQPGGARGKGEQAGAVKAFVPGRPFLRGHSREWILGLLPSLTGDRRNDFLSMLNLSPVLLTMDDESVRETLAAIEELSAVEDAKNPGGRRNRNGSLETLRMLAMLRLTKTNPEEAIELLKRNFHQKDGSTAMLVFGSLSADDPLRAEQVALSLEPDQQKEALAAVAYSLMNKDPQAALDLGARHPGMLDDRHQERILELWAQRDPASAMKAAVKEMEQSKNSELVRNTIEEWYKKDPAAAAQWAATHEGTGSIVARAMVLERRIKEDPQRALQEYAVLQQAGGDARELGRLTGALTDYLAKNNVHAAREWAQTLPEGDLRNRALHQVAEEWVKTDAPAASEWIRTLPPGQLRDGAAGELSGTLSRRDPASAFEWARSIENAKLREGVLRNVMQNWREQDPDAAKAALESLPAGIRPAP